MFTLSTLTLLVFHPCAYAVTEPEENDEPYYILESFVLTGSHLPASQLIPAPLTKIDADALQRWGDQTAIEAIRKEPYAFGSTNTENDSNSGTGSASANIHGLGNLSTLTLINGRRAGGNSAVGFQHGGFADLNLTPGAAIKEVQIATGGSSVTYGSDSTAGTVNLLLHNNYQGNRIQGSYANTTDGDAAEKTFSFLSGQDLGDSTHLVLLGSWYHRNSIEARDREISENADRRDQGGQNQSSTTFPGKLMVNFAEFVLKDGLSAPDTMSGALSDNYRPINPDIDFYNFSQAAVAIPEVERKSFMANLTHDLNDRIQIWTEFLYTSSEFHNGLAPAPWQTIRFPGFDFNPELMDAVRVSPHLPGSVDPNSINLLSYRSFELGNLENLQKKEALRGLVGFRGDLDEWSWETALLYIQTQLDEHWSGVADERILNDHIIDGSFNPFALEFTSGIIPGTTTPYSNAAALKDAEASPTNHYDETFWSYDFRLNGPLFELSAGEILAAIGFEYRDESVDVAIDPLFETGYNLGGAERASFSANRRVFSLFTEALVPLVASDTQTLDLGLALRYENYQDESDNGKRSNHYDALVYRTTLHYSPHEAVKLRAAFGTSFRAPTLTESYGGDNFANPIYNDPLGLTAPSSRVNTFVTSNPELDPEKSTNFNLGIKFEPSPGRGWSASMDYYHIQTKDVIANGAQYFVDQNASGQGPGFGTPGNFDPDAPFADQIVRNGATGALASINSAWFNAAESITDGIDYRLTYQHPTNTGYWQASIGLNQVLSYKLKASEDASAESFLGRFVDPRAAGRNIVGRGSIPEYKGYLELLWQHERLLLGATVNYVHSLEDNPAFTIDGQPRRVDAWTTLDLVASYTWSSSENVWLSNTTLTVGIDNVTDEAPPFAAGAFADGYDSSLYSLAGRQIRVSVSREF